MQKWLPREPLGVASLVLGRCYRAGEPGERVAANSWRGGQGAECHLVFTVPRPETLSHPGYYTP